MTLPAASRENALMPVPVRGLGFLSDSAVRWVGGLVFQLVPLLAVVAFMPRAARTSGTALIDMMGYLTAYLFAVLLTAGIYHQVKPRWQSSVLLTGSLAFFCLVVSVRLTAGSVVAVLLLYLLLRYASRGWWGIVLFGAWTVAFYGWVPAQVMDLSRGMRSLTQGIAVAMVMSGILMRTFHRALFAFFEVRTGRVVNLSFPVLLTYMIGLPFLTNSATPSLRHFLDSQDMRPEALNATIVRGARACLVCICCQWALFVVVALFPLEFRYHFFLTGYLHSAENILMQSPAAIWTMILCWPLTHYWHRMANEQLSVGAWRLFGHNLRDNFVRPLASRNLVDYWRRWDVLWREFLLAWVYYPMILALGRRFGPRTPWIFGAAACVTFLSGAVTDILPRALFFLTCWTPVNRSSVLNWCLAMAMYHIAWSIMLGVSLWWEVRRGRPIGRKAIWLTIPVQIALTYSVVSICRLFELPWLSIADKWHILWRACGY